MFQPLSLLPYAGLLGTLLTSTAHHLLLNSPEFPVVEMASQFCDSLRTVLDKHAPPSLRIVKTHNSSPWYESIRDERLWPRAKDVKQKENGGTQS